MDEPGIDGEATASAADHRALCRAFPGNTSLSRRQRQTVAHPDDAAAVARWLRLRSLRFARERHRRKQGPVLRGASQDTEDDEAGKARLGNVDSILPALSEKAE